jgi:protein TonB
MPITAQIIFFPFSARTVNILKERIIMKNNIIAFAVSLFIHLAVIAGIVLGSRGIKPAIKDIVTLDVSTIFEEKAPAAPKTDIVPEAKPETAKPPEKPKPPKPKNTPKPATVPKPVPKTEPKPEESAIEENISEAQDAEEADSPNIADTAESAPQETAPSGGGTGGAAEDVAGINAYMGKNFAYIQKRVARYTVYPARAKSMGIKGKLTVSFIINLDGTVSDVAIAQSSGHAVLDNAGIAAIKDAAPFPVPPASARIAIPISFDLL